MASKAYKSARPGKNGKGIPKVTNSAELGDGPEEPTPCPKGNARGHARKGPISAVPSDGNKNTNPNGAKKCGPQPGSVALKAAERIFQSLEHAEKNPNTKVKTEIHDNKVA
jgi:hypothetical protein